MGSRNLSLTYLVLMFLAPVLISMMYVASWVGCVCRYFFRLYRDNFLGRKDLKCCPAIINTSALLLQAQFRSARLDYLAQPILSGGSGDLRPIKRGEPNETDLHENLGGAGAAAAAR